MVDDCRVLWYDRDYIENVFTLVDILNTFVIIVIMFLRCIGLDGGSKLEVIFENNFQFMSCISRQIQFENLIEFV